MGTGTHGHPDDKKRLPCRTGFSKTRPPVSRLSLSPSPGMIGWAAFQNLRVCQPVCPRLKILAQLLPARLPHLAVSEHQAVIASQGGPRVLAVPALPGGPVAAAAGAAAAGAAAARYPVTVYRDSVSEFFSAARRTSRPKHQTGNDASWLAADAMRCDASSVVAMGLF
jgi:hypothetical protein